MAEQKVTRKNHPLLVKARQEGYQQGYRAGRKKAHQATIDACNHSIQTTKKHYQFIIDSLDKATNNQFSKIRFDYGEGDAGRSKSWITLKYYHSGEYRCITHFFKSGHRFTNIEFVNRCNELLEKMIKNHSREVENGRTQDVHKKDN